MFVTLRKAVGVCLPSDSRPAMCRGIPELRGEGVCVFVCFVGRGWSFEQDLGKVQDSASRGFC